MKEVTKTFEERVAYLKEKAKEIRSNLLIMINKAQSGHPGGSLSSTDFMAALYFDQLNVDTTNPRWVDRDRFVLSKRTCLPSMVHLFGNERFCAYGKYLYFAPVGECFSGASSSR